MVLSSELKVGQWHSDERSNDEENDEDYEEDAVYDVNSVAPDAGKNVVKFDVDGAKRQEPSHCHLRNGAPVPGQLWNLSWVFGGPYRRLELSLAVLTSNPTQNKERRGY